MINVILLHSNSLGGTEKFLHESYLYLKKKESAFLWIMRNRPKGGLHLSKNDRDIKVFSDRSELIGFLRIIPLLFRLNSSHRVIVSIFHYNVLVSAIKYIFRLEYQLVCRESTLTFSRFKGMRLRALRMLHIVSHRAIDYYIFQTSGQLREFKRNLKSRLDMALVKRNFLFELPDSTASVDFGEYIVGVGRLIELKGFQDLISAFILIRERFPNLNIVILGEGPYWESLSNQIKENSLEDKVYLIGSIQNIRPYIEKAKLCVIPSYVEGFPNVLNEMLYYNGRVLCSRSFDFEEGIPVLSNFEPGDIVSLANQIEKHLKINIVPDRISYLESITIQRYWQL